MFQFSLNLYFIKFVIVFEKTVKVEYFIKIGFYTYFQIINKKLSIIKL